MNYAKRLTHKLRPYLFDFATAAISVLIFIAYYEYLGTSGWLFYLVNTPPQLIVIPSLLLLTLFIFQKKPYILTLLVSLLFIVFTTFFAGKTPLSIQPIQSRTEGEKVRICSWNTAFFFEEGKDEGFKKLADSSCDIISLQEIWQSTENMDELSKYRDQYLPGMNIMASGEFVIFTKPQYSTETIRSLHSGFFGLKLTTADKTLTVVSIHLWNPITDKPVLADGVITRIKSNTARETQKQELLSMLHELTTDSHNAVAVMGDFNTMQNGKVIRDIAAIGPSNNQLTILSTPFWKNRNTYSTHRRLIQIDFAYLSREYMFGSSYDIACDSVASDHCLLLVDLLL